jgi:hypothetical protein
MVPTPVVVWDFSASEEGLVTEGEIPQWAWGRSTTSPVPVWKTRLAGPYLNDGTDSLILDLPDLAAYARPVLVVRHQWEILPGDRGNVEIDTGSGWRTFVPVYGLPDPSGFVGDSGGTVSSSFRLDGLSGAPRVRFLFSADETFSAAGWTIEGISLYDGDATPPRVEPLEIPVDTQDRLGPYPVRVTVEDDTAVSRVEIVVRVDGGTPFRVSATPVDGAWVAGIPAQFPGSFVEWHAEASDGALDARWPAVAEASFRVYLPPPTGLRADGRLVGQSLYLGWDALRVSGLTGYEVDDSAEGPRITTSEPHAVLPVTVAGDHEIRVRGLFGEGVGDWCEPLPLEIEVPRLESVSPAVVERGDLVHVDFAGSSLYLTDAAMMEPGPGISVRDLRVLDVGRASAVLEIAADAEPGPRDVVVSSAWGLWTFPGALTVGTDSPAEILSIAPSTLEQGGSADVIVIASQPFAGPLTQISTDPGIVATFDDPDGAKLVLAVVAGSGANPGTHELVLDDGVRWWTIPIEVTERTLSQQTCSHTGPPTGMAAFAALIAVLQRRSTRSMRAATTKSASDSAPIA